MAADNRHLPIELFQGYTDAAEAAVRQAKTTWVQVRAVGVACRRSGTGEQETVKASAKTSHGVARGVCYRLGM